MGGVPTLAWGVTTLAGGWYLSWLGYWPPSPPVWTNKESKTITFSHPTDAGGKNSIQYSTVQMIFNYRPQQSSSLSSCWFCGCLVFLSTKNILHFVCVLLKLRNYDTAGYFLQIHFLKTFLTRIVHLTNTCKYSFHIKYIFCHYGNMIFL